MRLAASPIGRLGKWGLDCYCQCYQSKRNDQLSLRDATLCADYPVSNPQKKKGGYLTGLSISFRQKMCLIG